MARVSLSNVKVSFPIFEARAKNLRFQLAQMVGSSLGADTSKGFVRVEALKGVDLDLQDGARVGLIGHNGSGKSTLLRTLGGIYEPTEGRCDIDGRVIPLLNIWQGVMADATGLENIYIKGMFMGFSRSEVEAHVDDIVEFSELGNYIHLPFRTYSQGMRLRLVFGTATSFTPDILLMDEVIGVGDDEFFARASARLRALVERTSIVVVASHAKPILNLLCNRVLKLANGHIVQDAPISALDEALKGHEDA